MKRGFTVVEFLAMLGIICIFAALIIPNFTKRYQNYIFASKLQRTYNVITNVMPSFLYNSEVCKLYDTSAFNIWINVDGIKDMENFLKTYFKTKKVCLYGNFSGLRPCRGEFYTNMDGNALNDFGGAACAILKIGSTICFDRMKSFNDIPHLYIDVNGPDGPNIWGRDAFKLEIDNDGNIAETFTEDNRSKYRAEDCQINLGGAGCFNKIVGDGWKMNY